MTNLATGAANLYDRCVRPFFASGAGAFVVDCLLIQRLRLQYRGVRLDDLKLILSRRPVTCA